MYVRVKLLLLGSSYLILATVAFLGNIYGICKIYKMAKIAKRKDRSALRRTNLYLLLHMCCSDMLTGLLATPFTGLTLLFQALGDDSSDRFWLHTVFCNISGFVQCTMSRVTILFAMGLVILRAMAIYLPKLIAEERFLKMTSYLVYITWMICLLMSCIPFFKGVEYKYNRNYEMGWWNLEEVFDFQQGVFIGYLIVDTIPFVVPGIVVFIGTGTVIATLTTLMVAGLFLISYGMWWVTSVVTLCQLAGWINETPEAFRLSHGQHNIIMMLSHGFLVFVNSAANPILYHFRLFKNVQKQKNGGITLSSFDRPCSQKPIKIFNSPKTPKPPLRSLSTTCVRDKKSETVPKEIRRASTQNSDMKRTQLPSRISNSSLLRYFRHHNVAPDGNISPGDDIAVEELPSEVYSDKEATAVSNDQNAESSDVEPKKLIRRVTFDDSQENNDFVRIKVIEKTQNAVILNQNFGNLN